MLHSQERYQKHYFRKYAADHAVNHQAHAERTSIVEIEPATRESPGYYGVPSAALKADEALQRG